MRIQLGTWVLNPWVDNRDPTVPEFGKISSETFALSPCFDESSQFQLKVDSILKSVASKAQGRTTLSVMML